jgi:hypothetical protein
MVYREDNESGSEASTEEDEEDGSAFEE